MHAGRGGGARGSPLRRWPEALTGIFASYGLFRVLPISGEHRSCLKFFASGQPAPPFPGGLHPRVLGGPACRGGRIVPAPLTPREARGTGPRGLPRAPCPRPPPPRTCAERPRLPSADKVGRPGLRATGLGRRAATGTVLCTATCSAGSPAGGDTRPGSAAGENRVEPSTGRGTPRGAAIPQRTRFPSGRPLLHQKTPFLLKDRPSSPRE